MAKRIYVSSAEFDGHAVAQDSLVLMNSTLDPFDFVSSVDMRCWERTIELTITGFGYLEKNGGSGPLKITAGFDEQGFHSIVMIRPPRK